MFGTNNEKPDPKRYVRQHGNGVTNYGIERAMRLLPAMRAIGHPENGPLATDQDLADVKACLTAYKNEGRLSAAGAAAMMWSDMGVYDSSDMDAVERLQLQDLPGGGTKYRYAFQAMPLAMTPSKDLMHAGWWHLLSDNCGSRNMEEFIDQDAAGAFLAGLPDMEAGPGKDGMAKKLADAWKGLDLAAPCTLKGSEGSARMMQFCALQAAAYLDGYDFMPDEDHARAIGRIVADGFQDGSMEDFKKLITESLYEHAQPEREAGYPDRGTNPAPEQKADRNPEQEQAPVQAPSAMDRLRGMLSGKDDDKGRGNEGPEL